MSFNQDRKSGEQHVQENKDDSRTCFKCEKAGHISPNCTEATKEDGSPLNNKEQANALPNKTFALGQQYLMDAEVVDAEDSGDTNDVEGEIA